LFTFGLLFSSIHAKSDEVPNPPVKSEPEFEPIPSSEKVEIPVPRAQRAIVIGHNVTPTTDTAPRGTWTAGNYAVGYSPTDSIMIATSPWIWASYNTANVHLKWAHAMSERVRVGFFASYFESFASAPFLTSVNGSDVSHRPPIAPSLPVNQGSGSNSGSMDIASRRPIVTSAATNSVVPTTFGTPSTSLPLESNRYQWKSSSLHLLTSYEFSHAVTTNLNLHYAYFWNDDFPYSIRMDPGRDSIRDQIDFTSLTRVRLLGSTFHWLFELGGLGLNYVAPYVQLGNSLALLSERWLVQIGVSSTVPAGEFWKSSGWTPGRYDTRVHTAASGQTYYFRYLQTALHPEVQLQFSF
jgi:hypothetical protein